MTTNTKPSGADALREALLFVEFCWREVAMNDYAEEMRARVEASLLAALSAAQDAPAEEVEALNDMLSDARLQLDMLREALGVKIEPHQSLFERMMDAARGAQAVPDGWKLVPVEATDEMVKVGDQKTWVFPSRECWAAMLSAAPAAPQPEISTEHGPWVESTIHEGETYCKRCLTRSVFAGNRECDPHIVEAPAAPQPAQQEHEAILMLARIEELEQSLARARKVRRRAVATLYKRALDAEAKLAEAQKDAARLDYVATGKVTVSRDNGGFQLAWYDHNSQKLKWQNSWHETARAAIDAAMKEQGHG